MKQILKGRLAAVALLAAAMPLTGCYWHHHPGHDSDYPRDHHDRGDRGGYHDHGDHGGYGH